MITKSPAKTFVRLTALVLCGTLLASCEGHEPEETATMIDVNPIEIAIDPEDWQTLSRMKVAFGHQSVGSDVIAGIKMLAVEDGVSVVINETKEAFTGPAFQHFMIGENGAPDTKLADFRHAIAQSATDSADIALLKLCYIDFNRDTDPTELARKYIAEIEGLSRQHPDTTFVAITAPLTTVQRGPKAIVKKLLGRSPAGYEGNAQRAAFNDLLRDRYANSNRLFDIAAIESGFGRHTIEYNGKRVEVLDPALTYDGGHLNDQGKRLTASALIHYLARNPGSATTAAK